MSSTTPHPSACPFSQQFHALARVALWTSLGEQRDDLLAAFRLRKPTSIHHSDLLYACGLPAHSLPQVDAPVAPLQQPDDHAVGDEDDASDDEPALKASGSGDDVTDDEGGSTTSDEGSDEEEEYEEAEEDAARASWRREFDDDEEAAKDLVSFETLADALEKRFPPERMQPL